VTRKKRKRRKKKGEKKEDHADKTEEQSKKSKKQKPTEETTKNDEEVTEERGNQEDQENQEQKNKNKGEKFPRIQNRPPVPRKYTAPEPLKTHDFQIPSMDAMLDSITSSYYVQQPQKKGARKNKQTTE